MDLPGSYKDSLFDAEVYGDPTSELENRADFFGILCDNITTSGFPSLAYGKGLLFDTFTEAKKCARNIKNITGESSCITKMEDNEGIDIWNVYLEKNVSKKLTRTDVLSSWNDLH